MLNYLNYFFWLFACQLSNSTPMASFGGTMAKLVLCLVNLVFILFSFAITLLGSRMYIIPAQQNILDAISWSSLSTLLIIVGIACATISVVGLGGALCESTYLLNAYVCFLALCSGAVLATFIGGIIFSDVARDKARGWFAEQMANFTYEN